MPWDILEFEPGSKDGRIVKTVDTEFEAFEYGEKLNEEPGMLKVYAVKQSGETQLAAPTNVTERSR